MPNQTYTWEAVVDTRQAARSINELPEQLRRAFGNVRIELINQSTITGARNAMRGVTNDYTNAQSQMTESARSQAQRRVGVAQDEANSTSQLARAFGRVRIQQEQEITAAVEAEVEKRKKTKESESSLDKVGFNLKDAVVGGALGYLTVQGGRQILETAKNIAILDTTISRSSKAFETLQGSAEKADRVLRAIQTASGGTVTEFQAIQIANQATSLGLATTTAQFEKLTRAARAVTFVSPVIHDVQSAITELALASANLSFRRLDQLGLSATEVKAKMAELQAANSNLDDSQAFLQASVESLNSKFGPLLDSVEAQATGVEKLDTAWANFMTNLASGNVGDAINHALGQIADGVDRFNAALTGDKSSLQSIDKLKGLVAGQKNPTGDAARFGGDFSQVEAQFQRLIDLYDQANAKIAAGVPGVQQYLDQINVLIGQAVESGNVTDEMATKMLVLEGTLNNVAGALSSTTLAGQAYAKANEDLGASFVSSDDRAQGLVGALVNLEIQKEQGIISAAQYAASVNAIAQSFAQLRGEAVAAATAVAGLNAQMGAAVTSGVATAISINRISAAAAASTRTNQLIGGGHGGQGEDIRVRNLGQQRADQAEAEKAAKAAASAAKKAATAGVKAFNQAEHEFESMIDSIVKVSQVTQQDIEDTQLGIYQNKPDEYLRRLRDEVNNGKDYKDVSIEDAAAGLNRIGIDTVGKSKEAILKLFERAFGNLSLFADEANLKFLDDTAVQEQIRLQELAKKGQENVYKHFGGVVESAVNAALGGYSGGGTADAADTGASSAAVAPVINIDGSALAGGNLDITATVTALELGDVALTDADIKRINDEISKEIKPKLILDSDSVGYTDDAVSVIKSNLATTLAPTLTLTSDSISMPVQDAEIARGVLTALITPTLVPVIDVPTPDAIQKFRDGFVEALKQNPVAADFSEFGLPTDPAKKRAGADFLNLKPKIDINAQSFNFPDADAASVRGDISSKIAPRLVFSSERVDFAADSAQLVNKRLSDQIKVRINLGDPDQGFYILPADAERISKALSTAIAPNIDLGVPGRISLAADAALAIKNILGALITPHITPIIDLPSAEALQAAQQSLHDALSQPVQGPPKLSEIGIPRNKPDNGSVEVARQYVTDISTALSTPDQALRMIGIGAQVRETINSGFTLSTDTTIGADYVAMMQRQIFSEANIPSLLAIGASTFAFIIAGFRNAMNDKSNTVGQEFVNGLAAQVTEAQTKAAKEEQ